MNIRSMLTRSFLLILLTAATVARLTAQNKYEPTIIEKLLLLGRQPLPDLVITSLTSGEVSNLSQLKPADLKYPGKPTLLLSWEAYCSNCLRSLESVIEEVGLKEFNIITLNINKTDIVRAAAKVNVAADSLQKQLAKYNAASLLNYQVKIEDYKKSLVPGGGTALWMFLDKDLKIVDHTVRVYLSPATVQEAIGRLSRGERYLQAARQNNITRFSGLIEIDESGEYPVAENKGDHQILSIYKKENYDAPDGVLSEMKTFKIVNGDLIADGAFKELLKNGKPANEGVIKNGRYMRLKQYHENGELSEDLAVDEKGVGYRKQWYADGMQQLVIAFSAHDDFVFKSYHPSGKLQMQGVVKNGKENGLHVEYWESGIKSKEMEIADDEIHGTLKEFDKTGNLIKTEKYDKGKKIQ